MKLETGPGDGKEITEGARETEATEFTKQSNIWETEKEQQQGPGGQRSTQQTGVCVNKPERFPVWYSLS